MLGSHRVWLGIAITVGFLVLLFLRVDFSEMRSAFATANYAYVIPGVVVYLLSLYIRALRWRYLLLPFARIRSLRLYPVVIVGYMANNVLPMRLGELARSYYLSIREPVRGSTALATVLVERVFDGFVMLFLLATAAFFLPVTGLAERVSDSVGLPEWLLAMLVIAPFVTVLGLMIIIAVYPDAFRSVALRLSHRLPERFGLRAYGLAERFIAGFEGLHRPQRLATVFVFSLPIWLAEGVMYYIVALGFGLQEQIGGHGAMVTALLAFIAVSNLATAIPSSQGSIGPFEFFGAMTLVFLGVSGGAASAYVIVLHVAILIPPIIVGAAHLASQSLTLGQLIKVQDRMEPVPAGMTPEHGNMREQEGRS